MVDGQLHADFGNGDVTHNAGAGNIQRVVVAGKLIRAVKGVFVGGHLCVKGIGGVKVGAVIRIGHFVHVLRVACHRAGLVALVDVIADSGYNITDRPTKKTRINIMVLLFFFMGYSLTL